MRFRLKAGHEAAFDQLVAQTMPGIRDREPGTLVYVVHTMAGRPAERVFYELYQDRAAFDQHERQEHVQAFLAARAQHLDSFEVDFLSATEGKT